MTLAFFEKYSLVVLKNVPQWRSVHFFMIRFKIHISGRNFPEVVLVRPDVFSPEAPDIVFVPIPLMKNQLVKVVKGKFIHYFSLCS